MTKEQRRRIIFPKLALLFFSIMLLFLSVSLNKEETERLVLSFLQRETVMKQVYAQGSPIEKWCNTQAPGAEANCATYGGLYTWAMATQGEGAGGQGICPSGWHVPTDQEWMELEEYLGMCSGTGTGCSGASGWRGTNQGSKLAGNASLWRENRTIVTTNGFAESGLFALPGGYRNTDGSFGYLLTRGGWWSSSESALGGSNAWRRFLYRDSSTVTRNANNKDYGFSVRCLRD